MISIITDNLVTSLIALVFIWLYLWIKKSSNFFKDKGIPYVESSLISCLKTFSIDYFSKTVWKTYDEMKERYSYVGIFTTFNSPILILNEPSLAQDVLIRNFSHFSHHGLDYDFKLDPLARQLFNMKGDQWKKLRNKLIPTFTSGKLKGMVTLIEECAQTLIDEMKQDPALRRDVPMKKHFATYTISVMAKCAFGLEPKNIKDPNCQFQQLMKRSTEPPFKEQIKLMMVVNYPRISSALKLKTISKEVDEYMLNFIKESFRHRKESGERRNDFIQLLLELKEKGSIQLNMRDLEQDEQEAIKNIQSDGTSDKLEMTDELLAAQVLNFIVAGLNNVSYSTAATAYGLSTHPEIQEKVREEIKSVKAKYGGVDYASLKDMQLLGACIDEALRLYAPNTFMVRHCTKTYTMSDGKTIDKGSTVAIPVEGFHNDSKFWPNPKKFDPYRFLETNKIQPCVYLPFGDGPRSCIARPFALLTTKIMVMRILEEFDILPSSKTQEPVQVEFGLTVDFRGGSWANFEPRCSVNQ